MLQVICLLWHSSLVLFAESKSDRLLIGVSPVYQTLLIESPSEHSASRFASTGYQLELRMLPGSQKEGGLELFTGIKKLNGKNSLDSSELVSQTRSLTGLDFVMHWFSIGVQYAWAQNQIRSDSNEVQLNFDQLGLRVGAHWRFSKSWGLQITSAHSWGHILPSKNPGLSTDMPVTSASVMLTLYRGILP